MARRKELMGLDCQIREAERRAYWKGVAEGERRGQKMINCTIQVNARLLDLVRVLDEDHPLVGVVIPFDLADRIVTALCSPGSQRRIAAELQQAIDRTNRALFPELPAVERQLLELVG